MSVGTRLSWMSFGDVNSVGEVIANFGEASTRPNQIWRRKLRLQDWKLETRLRLSLLRKCLLYLVKKIRPVTQKDHGLRWGMWHGRWITLELRNQISIDGRKRKTFAARMLLGSWVVLCAELCGIVLALRWWFIPMSGAKPRAVWFYNFTSSREHNRGTILMKFSSFRNDLRCGWCGGCVMASTFLEATPYVTARSAADWWVMWL